MQHIFFCLEEIDCEIDALDEGKLPAELCAKLREQVGMMRQILNSAIEDKKTDDLALVRGIDAELAVKLLGNGVSRFQTIANWSKADIEAVAAAVPDLSFERIAAEGWIEQAAMLAQGKLTVYAKRVQAGDMAAVVPVGTTAADEPATEAIVTIVPAQTTGAVEIVVADIQPAPDASVVTLPTAPRPSKAAGVLSRIAASLVLLAAASAVVYVGMPVEKTLSTIVALN